MVLVVATLKEDVSDDDGEGDGDGDRCSTHWMCDSAEPCSLNFFYSGFLDRQIT